MQAGRGAGCRRIRAIWDDTCHWGSGADGGCSSRQGPTSLTVVVRGDRPGCNLRGFVPGGAKPAGNQKGRSSREVGIYDML